VIEPVGDLVGVITPLPTNPVCWNTPSTSPFSQRHWMHVDQFAQFSGCQSSITTTKVINDVHLPHLLSLDEKTRILTRFRPTAHAYITAAVVTVAVAICALLKSLNVFSTAALVSGEFKSAMPR